MLEDLQHLGIAFVSLGEGIDCTTPAGKLQLHILAALAEFERERIRERVLSQIGSSVCGASNENVRLVGRGVTGPTGPLVVIEGDKPFETDKKLASELRPVTP